jgi:tetratricopeptide (TPR) repeat protein
MHKMPKTFFSLFFILLFVHLPRIASSQVNEVFQLEKNVRLATNEDDKTAAYLALSAYYLENNLEKADSLRNQLQSETVSFNKLNRTKIILQNVAVLEKMENYQALLETMRYFDKLDYSKFSTEIKTKILTNKGFAATFYNDRTKAQKYLNLALSLARSSRDFSQSTTILNLLAYESLINREKVKSIEFSEKAIEYARRSGDKKDLSHCFNIQAKIYQFFGENEVSIRKNFLAFELANEEKDYHELARFAYEIGQMQESVGNLGGANYYYEISLANAKKVKDKSQMGQAYSAIANVLRRDKKYKESLKMNFDALKLADPQKDQIRVGDIEKNIGQNLKDLGSLKEAKKHFQKAIEHYENGKNKERIAEIYLLIGEVLYAEGDKTKALEILLQSISTSERYGTLESKFKTYPLVAKIYNSLNQKDVSIKYLSEYIEYTERTFEREANNKIAQLGEQFRSEERDRMIAKQAESLDKQKRVRQLTESKLENATLRSKLQTYLLLVFFIIILLVSVIGFYRSRQNSIQQKRKEAEMSQILLRTQMNPHFIFNAMSIIQSYIYENDVKTSSEFLVSFSRLIRLILENSPKEFISIATEIDILTKYLETQKLRFEKRFEYEIICPEKMIFENTLIPPMITQPFVENSIAHGELHRLNNGKIIVEFAEKNGMLAIQIQDNGIGRQHAAKNKKGNDHQSMGMKISQDRIRIINEKQKSSGSLQISDLDPINNSGTLVEIFLPLKKELI